MKVYFIRHGETTDNAAHIHQGWNDVHLSEKGEKQVLRAKRLLDGIKFDKIFCSDIYRAKQTCSLIFNDRDDIIYDERLREINNSVLTGIPYAEMIEKYGEEHLKRTRAYDFTFYGGESGVHLKERVEDFMHSLEEIKGVDRIAAVTHCGVIHAVEAVVFGIAPTSCFSTVENGSINVVKYEDGKWKTVNWNYTGKIK